MEPARSTSEPSTSDGAAPLLIASGLSKAYSSQVRALQDVSLQISRGQMLAITGRSGSGKSTLLHCLSGITTPDAGTVLFDGVDLVTAGEGARSALRRERMSFVFQRNNLDPALTVHENAGLALLLRGARRAVLLERVADALEVVRLEHRASSFPHELSGGEQQRVALARALATEPDVVWADEPTGSLDWASAREVLTALRCMCTDGTAVVLVTHDPDVAAAADAVVALEDGRRTR